MRKKILKCIFDLPRFLISARDIEKLSYEIFVGIGAIIGSLYIFLKLTNKIVKNDLIFFDYVITKLLHDIRTPSLTETMRVITFFGGEIFIGSAILATIFILFRKHKKDAVVFGFILIFGIILNLWLKGVFARPRPEVLALVIEKTFSFPSGHAMNSSVFFLSLTYFIFRNTRDKLLGLFLALFSGFVVFLIGVSRVYLGVHYPSDVLGGYAAGLIWFAAVLLFEKTIIFLKLFRKFETNRKY